MSRLTKIDDWGDLTLILGTDKDVSGRLEMDPDWLLVFKSVLRLASPVWRRMLAPDKWSESATSSIKMP